VLCYLARKENYCPLLHHKLKSNSKPSKLTLRFKLDYILHENFKSSNNFGLLCFLDILRTFEHWEFQDKFHAIWSYIEKVMMKTCKIYIYIYIYKLKFGSKGSSV
jgi:hypothetical protein